MRPAASLVPRWIALTLALVAFGGAVAGCGSSSSASSVSSPSSASPAQSASAAPTPSGSKSAAVTPTAGTGDADRYAGLAPAVPVSTLRTMTVAQLPKEGIATLELIASDGPFPYSKDGATFSNREKLLPKHPSGWYREYTVVTPGSSDRGARRIIGGQDGARFYTSDHYDSFREVVSGGSS